ncbi:hypothetical protein OESDEN_05427 [Oesophagostomum dentatum]|uniref:MSP domain-containing protein n=1 Tax=Oesophagostomum dentatum TaxID=61180 RepID=A0A0B1TAU3_OESDE|nr:hypothetical protein OESDEN_05427 [Oesophagostomum dentatum]
MASVTSGDIHIQLGAKIVFNAPYYDKPHQIKTTNTTGRDIGVLDLKESTLMTCLAIPSAMAMRTPTAAVSPSNGAAPPKAPPSTGANASWATFREQQNPAEVHQTAAYRSVLLRFTCKFV